jgi:aminopeptidase YwaD
MFKYALSIIILLYIVIPSLVDDSHGGNLQNGISPVEIISYVRYLSSDALEGRMTGEKGSVIAADYIAGHFKESGLEPFGDEGTYFQNFPLPESMVPGKSNLLTVTTRSGRVQLEMGEDFCPLDLSASGSASGGLVFAGYGISAPDLGYDDYEGLEVKGKIVIVLRGAPRDPDFRSNFYDFSSFRYKADNARKKGAKGIIFTTPPSLDEEKDLEGVAFESSPENEGIPAVIIRRDKAEKILHSDGKDLTRLEERLSGRMYASFVIHEARAEMRTEIVKVKAESANVIGFLPGSDPSLKGEVIVIGAHYDHLGRGENHVGGAEEKAKIYNGADDNASGVAGLLELSKYFARKRGSLRRSLLFIAFSGEEIGLLGSSYFIEHTGIPPGGVVEMINMDMIGRLRENKLMIIGVGSGEEWKGLIDKANSGLGLHIAFTGSAFGPSDQTVFYADNIPSVEFFTGIQEDYHTPEDDWQKINRYGEEKVLDLIANLITELGNRPGRVTFTGYEEADTGPAGLDVYLGTIPDYTSGVRGVKLAGIKKGSPAEKAGLSAGDTIIDYGGSDVGNIYEYYHALERSKPGIPVELTVIRAGRRIKIVVVPGPRKKK